MTKVVDKQFGGEDIIRLPGYGVVFAIGATIPSDGGSGYAKGCLYTTTTTGKLYINTGSGTSATWTVAGTQS